MPAGNFFPAWSGACGQEFICGAHFPDEFQGCFVRVRVRHKPVHTVELHTRPQLAFYPKLPKEAQDGWNQ